MLDKDCFSSESDRPGLMKNIGGALVPEAMPQFSVSDCMVPYAHAKIMTGFYPSVYYMHCIAGIVHQGKSPNLIGIMPDFSFTSQLLLGPPTYHVHSGLTYPQSILLIYFTESSCSYI